MVGFEAPCRRQTTSRFWMDFAEAWRVHRVPYSLLYSKDLGVLLKTNSTCCLSYRGHIAEDTALTLDHYYLPLVPSLYKYFFSKNKFDKSLQKCFSWNRTARQ